VCPYEEKKEEGKGQVGGGLAATITMTTNTIIGHCCPHSWGGEDVVSTPPRTNQTMLNYNLIPTSPTEQRKCLRKGGLCWDETFVLGEHVPRIMSAKWNGDRQGGAEVAAVAAVAEPRLPPGKGSWSSGPVRGFAAS
jgi:hypothetical protein